MGNVKLIIIRLFIMFFSVSLIDGGKSFMILSDNIQIILFQDHTSDLEVPDQHHQVNINGEEQWIETYEFDFSPRNSLMVKFLHFTVPASQDFSGSVWQPPRFV